MTTRLVFALLLTTCAYPQSTKENLAEFTKQFFNDEAFQRQRIQFPLYESVCYYDDSKGKEICQDTLICGDRQAWVHLSYGRGLKGVTHKFYTNEKSKTGTPTAQSRIVFMEFQQEESDFNLVLTFQNVDGRWYLIKEKEWTF